MEKTILDSNSLLEIDILDKQHSNLINKGNELIQLIKDNSSKEDILLNYESFISLVIEHFQSEEEYFKAIDYEGASHHIEIHEFFVNFLIESKNNYIKSKTDLSLTLIKFLNEWAKNHINSMDLSFAKIYKSQKLKL